MVYTVGEYNYFIGIAKNKSFVIYEIDDLGRVDVSTIIQSGILAVFHDDIQVVYDPKKRKQYLCCINISESILEIYDLFANGTIKIVDYFPYNRENKNGTAVYSLNNLFYFYEQSKRALNWEISKYVKNK